ncbi:hypothetical protein [Mucilaginibacter pocheonensis]|uniref:Uncharacterized protein n=1 Tax=Mucilaginibacter pocheonensis TaxID=398050 RepID=A0ABU1T6N2_9SPHI|nr:hypothetical protein [Mucilaginibacter pocheonensis]MDR6940886.1 hypothetical protein [Mucilaginibacter pocheonensis]
MLKGIYLTLLIGPGVPIPAPQILVDALSNIQVTNSKDRSGFQISFLTGKNSSIVTTMLPAGFFDPITTRVILIATLNGIPNVIMDGLVTNHQLGPSNEPGKSTLTITGEDLSLAMDIIDMIIPYPAMPEVAIINLILAKYAFLGVVPLVIPPIISLIQSPTETWRTQPKMTDRAYIKQLASKCGYLFFVEAGPFPGQSIAYFGPDVNAPVPQPALTVNMDGATNVESISFSLDGLAKKVRIYTIMDPITKKIPIPIPVPNINLFKPPMGARPTPPSKIEFATDVAQADATEAAQGILGFLLNNSAAVSGSGSIDVLRYQYILRSRMMVGVRGAGITYDGMYFVDSVTHNIKPGEYKQSFTLSRDGVISNTPFVLT